MKLTQNFKKSGAVIAFGFLTVSVFSQTATTKGELPFDESTKQEWIKSHSAEYNKMNGQTTPTVKAMPFDETNKAAWIKAHPAEYKQLNGEVVVAPTATNMKGKEVVSKEDLEKEKIIAYEIAKQNIGPDVNIVLLSDYNNMDPEKKAYINAHPEHYLVEYSK